MVRWLGAPKEYQAWIYLHKKLWDKVKKWEIIYTMYSPSANKLWIVKEMQKEKDFYTYDDSNHINEKVKNIVKKLT